MIRLTKVFHFETAHAIHGYNGQCKNIHGHSYELHVTVAAEDIIDDYIPAPGFILDFKDIKKVVTESIVKNLDHKIVLSKKYMEEHAYLANEENLIIWDFEPTAENILLYVKNTLLNELPTHVKPVYLKIYETKNSYAEWIAS